MIELSRHIEILLLSNDCVIVPGLGGFMAHHVDARYDEEDNLFLPPLRTLGFNPQLTMNDSLLAQSYVETYDISYPEALRRIEGQVNELIQHIHNEGSYELNGIGTLSLNSEECYIFSPCEAGILSPSLYALSSFDFPLIQGKEKSSIVSHNLPAESNSYNSSSDSGKSGKSTAHSEIKPIIENSDNRDNIDDDDDNRALIIKLTWIRNAVAVAAAVLIFFMLTTPISNSNGDTSSMAYTNFNTSAIFDTTKKLLSPQVAESIGAKGISPEINKDSIQKAVNKDTVHKELAYVDSTTVARILSTELKNVEETPKEEALKTESPKDLITSYCIVLASYVSKKNANAFVEHLHKAGFEDAQVYIRNKVTRVVYGNYRTLNDAYNHLNRVRGNKDFEEAWVLKTTDRG